MAPLKQHCRKAMDAATYDAWYDTARGRWIGDTEYRLLRRSLAPAAGKRQRGGTQQDESPAIGRAVVTSHFEIPNAGAPYKD